MDNQLKKTLTVLTLLVVLPSSSMAASLWSDVATSQPDAALQAKQPNPHANSRRVTVDLAQLQATLASANALTAGLAAKTAAQPQLELPMPDGSQQVFNIAESSIMEPELAAKYPQIKTYKATATNDVSISGRLDLGPQGFHGYLFTAKGEVFIDPIPGSTQQEYYSYYKNEVAGTQPRTFSCGVEKKVPTASPVAEFKNAEILTAARTSGNIITYRMAVATTGEYSLAVGAGNIANTLAAVVTAINRVNEIYIRDLGIRLDLVANNDLIIFTDPTTDPYLNPTDGLQLLDENQAKLDSVIGTANYDLGHVFGAQGGGVASVGVACYPGYKARGETGTTTPLGDAFYIDYVAHEIGHQLGADHSFNGTTGSCSTRNATTAFEPGSGSTIMAYAGICGAENLQLNSDATFHAGSIVEILAHTRTGSGNACAGTAGFGSAAPVVDPLQNYTIPGGTAFTLTGSASDLEVLTYQWDEMDAGTATIADSHGLDNGSNALFRSFLPQATAERTFPQLSTILLNVPDKAETLPTKNRTLNFRLTARDGLGGVDEKDMQVIVDAENTGPFKVLQPNGGETLNSTLPQTIEWNTACTNVAPVSCANVDILFSADGGQNFASIVGGTTPNVGYASVSLPVGDIATARIKIACVGNIFFDISDLNFATSSAGGSQLLATGAVPSCGIKGGDDIEPNDSVGQAQGVVFPATVNGTVNDGIDIDDYFVFVANASRYTMTLSNYGSFDLDLTLYDSAGQIIAFSWGEGPTELIVKDLIAGETYYLQVEAWVTLAQDSTYTLTVTEGPIPSGGGGGGVLSTYWLLMLLITPLLRLQTRRVH